MPLAEAVNRPSISGDVVEKINNLPTVSVIVPCYNYGQFLAGCVASVLNQSGVEVQLLIVDDCSTDSSAAVARELSERHEQIEFRQHSQNMGLIPTANEGLEWAEGDYVVLLSADDLLVPGSLQRSTTIMTELPQVGMVYGRPIMAAAERPIATPSNSWRTTDVWPGAKWIRERCRSGHNCISSPEALVRMSVQRAVGGYDPSCHHTSDLNMWLRIAAVADIAYIRGAPQAIYRVHALSMWRSQDGYLSEIQERRAAFDSFFSFCASNLDRPDELRATVARTLARQALWRASRAVDHAAGGDVVADLVEFAFDVYPDSHRLREWRGLVIRRKIGAGRSLIFFPFIATGIAHRLRHLVGHARLRRRGV